MRIYGSVALFVALASASPARAGYYTDPIAFVDPAGWDVGDAGSTYQLWDNFGTGTTFAPDAAIANPAVSSPTLTVTAPGFTPSGGGRVYSFSTSYGLTAAIDNTTSVGTPGSGTHVVVQVASIVNPDVGSVVPGSIRILDASGNVLADGGENADLLRATTFGDGVITGTPVGAVDFELSIFEFFLARHTGDFRVAWTQAVHTGLDALRVDSKIADEAFGLTAVPEPASLALLAVGAALAGRRGR